MEELRSSILLSSTVSPGERPCDALGILLLAQNHCGVDRADPLGPSRRRLGLFDHMVDPGRGLIDLAVQTMDILDVVQSELDPHLGRRIGRLQLVDQVKRPVSGQITARPARDQLPDESMQPGDRLGL